MDETVERMIDKLKENRTIGIRVHGTRNKVYLPELLQAGQDLMDILTEVDLAISQNHKLTTDWKLRKLSYASPATLEVEPEAKEDQPDNGTTIVNITIAGMDSLRKYSERPKAFTDKALEAAKDLAKLLQDGVERIDILSGGIEIPYVNNIIDNVNVILTPGKTIYGSVEGRIERMNSHDEFSFWLYEPILSRRIKGQLKDANDSNLRHQIIELYEQMVIVSGLLHTNINGEVNSVEVTDISSKLTIPLLKNASEVTAIWDFTGGISPVEHIRRMRDDS
jgi:hypothetical protein